MDIQQNISLRKHSTMRLGGNARYLAEITERSQIAEAVKWAEQRHLPVIMIGQGSNIIWGDEGFDGLVLVNKIVGFEVYEIDDRNVYLTIGAGENWDSAVARSVELGFSGIEYLSLIPGTAGATPIQNVGAYGREIKDVLTTLEAYDQQAGQLVTMRGADCQFAYRTSRFKTADKNRFFITSITLHVTKTNPKPPFYDSLQKHLDEHSITAYTSQVIREAVIAIRSSKLPDPAVVANNGSFFFNPVVDKPVYEQLVTVHPGMPSWPTADHRVKLSAAWLVEQSGFKNQHDQETGMATWHAQPLVLVNESADKTANLLQFRDKIIDAVKQKFGIELTQEPELIPSEG